MERITMTAYSRRNNCSYIILVCIAIAVVLISQTTAIAELLPASGAMTGWSGTKNFSAGGKLFVNVEYAVYEPGTFDVAFPGKDPSNGQEFVYAYQLLNTTNSTDKIQKLTVGLDPNASPSNIGEISDPILPSGIASLPVFAGSPPGSATWSYFSTVNVPANSKSEILIYTSPNGPKWMSSTLGGFRAGTIGYVPEGLPSPVPEPFAPLCLALAGLCFLAKHLKKIVF
jgi:hypothetical protein